MKIPSKWIIVSILLLGAIFLFPLIQSDYQSDKQSSEVRTYATTDELQKMNQKERREYVIKNARKELSIENKKANPNQEKIKFWEAGFNNQVQL